MIWGVHLLEQHQNWAAPGGSITPALVGTGVPCSSMGDCPALSSLQIQTRSHSTCLELGANPPQSVSSLRPLMVLFFYTQGSPPATAEAADSGDGQGFSHLQVGRHADRHLPHGEFPEGTHPNHPAPPAPQAPSLPSLHVQGSWGRRNRAAPQLTPGPSARWWGRLSPQASGCCRWKGVLSEPWI